MFVFIWQGVDFIDWQLHDITVVSSIQISTENMCTLFNFVNWQYRRGTAEMSGRMM